MPIRTWFWNLWQTILKLRGNWQEQITNEWCDTVSGGYLHREKNGFSVKILGEEDSPFWQRTVKELDKQPSFHWKSDSLLHYQLQDQNHTFSSLYAFPFYCTTPSRKRRILERRPKTRTSLQSKFTDSRWSQFVVITPRHEALAHACIYNEDDPGSHLCSKEESLIKPYIFEFREIFSWLRKFGGCGRLAMWRVDVCSHC